MRTLEVIANEIAATNLPVLIVGESGTGKQVLARRIHETSLHRDSSMLQISCGTLTPDTMDSNLRLRDDRAVSIGSVIFDEISELDRDCQRKLLRLLPDGDDKSSKERLSARIISTSSQNLEDEVRAGRFRNDLFYRLNGVCLRIPPLRERREDIPLLVDFFLAKHAMRFGRTLTNLSSTGMTHIMEHSWSGNVRELENIAMKVLALGDEEVALADLSRPSVPARTTLSEGDGRSLKAAARAASREAERVLILKALSRTQWNRKRAAQELQISYKSLLYKLKQISLPNSESE